MMMVIKTPLLSRTVASHMFTKNVVKGMLSMPPPPIIGERKVIR